MKNLLLTMVLVFSTLALQAQSREYEFAINVKNWCYQVGNSSGMYGHLMYLDQIMGDYAVFVGKGMRIVLNKNDLKGKIYKNKTLAESVAYIGKIGDVKAVSKSGFPVTVEAYVSITGKEFLQTPKRTGRSRGDCQ